MTKRKTIDEKLTQLNITGAKLKHTAWLWIGTGYWPNPHYRGEPEAHPLSDLVFYPPEEIEGFYEGRIIGVANPKNIGIDKDHPIIQKVNTLVAKHTKKVGDCLIWTGETDNNNNPITFYLEENRLQYKLFVRRLVYSSNTHTADIGKNQRISSTCDYKKCVNRDHLILVNKNSIK